MAGEKPVPPGIGERSRLIDAAAGGRMRTGDPPSGTSVVRLLGPFERSAATSARKEAKSISVGSERVRRWTARAGEIKCVKSMSSEAKSGTL